MTLQAKLAEAEELSNLATTRETQASNRANALQAQLQTAENARGDAPDAP